MMTKTGGQGLDVDRLVVMFSLLFPPNPLRHGLMREYDETTGKKESVTINGNVTLAMVRDHLMRPGHKGRIGYQPGTDQTTSVGCIDIDRKGLSQEAFDQIVSKVKQALSMASITWYVEESTNGGAHIWVFSDAPVPYEIMHLFLKAFTLEAGEPSLEVFPSSADGGALSKWVYMPYGGAIMDDDGLGSTFLATNQGQPVKLALLFQIVKNPSSIIAKHAEYYRLDRATTLPGGSEDLLPMAELDPEQTIAELERVVMEYPESAERHGSQIAFLNVASRASKFETMAEKMKTLEVWRVWVQDGSRTHQEWIDEIERWEDKYRADFNALRGRYGLKFLIDQGWELGALKRKASARIYNSKDLGKVPEIELAEAFASWLPEKGEHWLFDPRTQAGYHYDGVTYERVPNHREAIKGVLDSLFQADPRLFGKALREARLSPVYKKLERTYLAVDLREVTRDDLICCTNGLLDWRTGELHPHDPEKITVGRVSADWNPHLDTTEGPWGEFLRVSLGGQAHAREYSEVFQEFLGYSLTRRTHMRRMLNLHGPSSTGKTTAWRILAGVMGNVSEGDDSGLAMSTDQGLFDAQDWALQMLQPNLVIFDELNTSDPRAGRIIVTRLKIIAGGGSVTVNPKGVESTSSRLGAKIIFCTNNDIRAFEDASNDALFRRIVRIPFNNVIRIAEDQPSYHKRVIDSDLERSRVLLWMVEGLQRLAANNWTLSHSDLVDAQMDEARATANPIIEYLTSCTEISPEHSTGAKDLLEDFHAWAIHNSMKSWSGVSSQVFVPRLRDALDKLGLTEQVERNRRRQGFVWDGIGVTDWLA